jgi:hypothetical protein
MMFKGTTSFSLHIEKLAIERKLSYMDAVLKYCEENYLEPDDIKHLINKTLKDKIEQDMMESNLLPKKATLNV